jgi:hypothetical protein
MYIPIDLTRQAQKPIPFSQLLASSIYPVQLTDPNAIFNLNDNEFGFNYLESTYKVDVGIRISRTPLSPSDPSTYAAISKFTEYYLRKYHSSSGAQNSNQLDKLPLSVPKELIGAQSDGKSDTLLMGSMLNPLISDVYKPVHLIPGCISSIVNFSKSHDNNNTLSNKLFGKPKFNRSEIDVTAFKQPKNNVNRNTSAFIERLLTCDNYVKKLNNADTILISAHGRILNVIVLEDGPKDIEIDPPCLRMTISTSTITCFSTFKYVTSNNEKNLDILFAFATGDILWLNPLRMRYSRWNKNNKIKNEIIISIEWSRCGNFAFVGFADGEIMIFDRNFEDPDVEYIPVVEKKEKYIKIFKSLKTDSVTGKNPIAHYKFTNKPITSIRTHPIYNNLIVFTSDDGFIRLFDVLGETITDIIPSYYAGVLTSEFTQDGKFLLVGGEDDMVSIFEVNTSNIFTSPTEQGLLKLITRLQGSKSWIRNIVVKQSALNSPMDYIIGTASDDGYIRFYEFQPRNLRKVKKYNKHTGNMIQVGSPKYQMQKVFSQSSVDPNIDLRKKRQNNKSSNTLSSLNNGINRLSLLEMINQGSSSTSLQQLQQLQQQNGGISVKIGDGNKFTSTMTSAKYELMSKNVLFQGKNISPNRLFFRNFKNKETYVHASLGMDSISKLLPVCEKNVNLGRLSSLHLGKDYIWAFLSSGDLVRWKKNDT